MENLRALGARPVHSMDGIKRRQDQMSGSKLTNARNKLCFLNDV